MQEIDARTAMGWLAEGKVRIIDVREPAEFAAGHIAGAQSLPLSRLDNVSLAPRPGEKLVLVCASGRRSGMACARIAAPGVEAYSLSGGVGAWTAAGGAMVAGERKVLPLERQVLLGAGLLVLVGVLLAVLVHPGFVLLAGFVGLGLVVAGLTGFCGMALLLARAPWNQRAPGSAA